MDCCYQVFGSSVLDRHPSFLRQPEIAAQQRLRGSSSQANDHLGFQELYFSFKPGLACTNFRHSGLLVKPSFASFFKSEVLDHVGNVGCRAINRGIRQGTVEDPAGGTYKRIALKVLFIARLFADQDNSSSLGPSAENGLGRIQITIATVAGLHGSPQQRESLAIRKEGPCTRESNRRCHNPRIRYLCCPFPDRNRMDEIGSI